MKTATTREISTAPEAWTTRLTLDEAIKLCSGDHRTVDERAIVPSNVVVGLIEGGRRGRDERLTDCSERRSDHTGRGETDEEHCRCGEV
jgi:hypothetical protein